MFTTCWERYTRPRTIMKKLLRLINAASDYLEVISYLAHFSWRRYTLVWVNTIFVSINTIQQMKCSNALLWKQRSLRLLSSGKASMASSAGTSLIQDNITRLISICISTCILMISILDCSYEANCITIYATP